MSTIAEILETKRRQLADTLANRNFNASGIPLPQFGSAQRFLLLSILIGVFSGLLVVCFHFLIEFISWSTLGVPVGESLVYTLLFPPFGALVSVLLIREVFPRAEGSGINNTKAAIYISDGYIPLQSVFGKFLACSISIGSGNSLGPEDPALQMGAGVASYIGRSFHLAREHMRLIAPVGAAAGIAAAFNTPITAVLFVIEEVIGSWNAGVLGSIVLSAVSSVVVTRSFLGDQPLFRVPEFQFRDPLELVAYAVMGVAGGLVSVAFVRALVFIRERFSDLGSWRHYALPAIAGFLVGCIGLGLPGIMGAGYESVDSALHDEFGWHMLLLLCLAKFAATVLCFSAGTPGGMFAPTLFMGATLGGGVGLLIGNIPRMPEVAGSAYVLVGMGTLFAGIFRTPMTSIFMVFEVSASYVIILPVMIANTIAYLISRRFLPEPFFELMARHEGLDLPSNEEQRERESLHVEDAMSRTRRALSWDMSVDAALHALRQSDVPYALVSTRRAVWASVSLAAVERAREQGKGDLPLAEAFALTDLPRLYMDLALDEALSKLSKVPILPIVSRARPDQLLGSITLNDIHKAFGIKA
ncbi:MAG: chloride channel protein [Bryobacterales bacterium]|nr:chloride channel protein [Bryobacterales bacterium]